MERNVDGRSAVRRSVGSGRWAVGKVLRMAMAGSLFLVVVCVGGAQDADKAPAGAEIFSKKCVLCHGADGTGNTPLGKQLQAANLHSKEVQKLSNDEMHKIIHDGQANMPPFEDKLTDDEIDQVIQYVRTFAGPVKAAKKQ